MSAILIRHTGNGYIVSTDHPLGEPSAFEAPDTPTGQVEALGRALWDIIERLGMIGSKHDAARVRVVVEPGTDYVGDAR